MSYPLEFVSAASRKKTFFSLLALTLLLFGVMKRLDAPLRNLTAAPNGIISFELAGSPEKAEAITQSWGLQAHLFAAFGLGVDYLFLAVYGLTLSLGVLMAGKKQGGRFEKFGVFIAWGVLLAALSDAIENYFLWQILIGAEIESAAAVAAFAATVKFFLLAVGIGFALTGWLRK
jgi:hypothetical protein